MRLRKSPKLKGSLSLKKFNTTVLALLQNENNQEKKINQPFFIGGPYLSIESKPATARCKQGSLG
jgi:hypothetical protein